VDRAKLLEPAGRSFAKNNHWSRIVRILVLAIAFLIGTGLFARSGDDVATAQSVIKAQEEAFGRDDAATAYSFAAPAIQSYFRNPDGFMFMVRNNYAPVYRHRSFEFGLAMTADGKIIQQVGIVDADGVAWDAVYTLEAQPDGSLKITACILKKAATS
jgi:Domain of unknown function (DUF4864)